VEIFRLKESNANAALITGLAVMPSGETGRIGAPLFGGDGAGSIGMFSGYCGTLMTPMAANYNVAIGATLSIGRPNADWLPVAAGTLRGESLREGRPLLAADCHR
jgi:uncharacterized membrane protein